MTLQELGDEEEEENRGEWGALGDSGFRLEPIALISCKSDACPPCGEEACYYFSEPFRTPFDLENVE